MGSLCFYKGRVMDDKAKGIAEVKSQVDARQSGFVILMGLLILVLGAAAWYGSVGGKKSESMKASFQGEYVANLQHVKERMLTYAILHPEIFDKGSIFNPGIGYFPCPDTSGDGVSNTGPACSQSRSLYALGWVPQKMSKKSFSFLSTSQKVENKRYWFAVDTRFLADAKKYHYDSFTRFAPLNIKTPSLVDTTGNSNCDDTPGNPITAKCVPPLTLDGQQDIVMVLFYAGDTSTDKYTFRDLADKLAAEKIQNYLEQPSMNIPSHSASYPAKTGVFISKSNGVDPFNDYVIAITREEWNAAMLSRVAKDANRDGVPDLCEIPLDVQTNDKNSWFDDCRYSGSEPPYNLPNHKPCTHINDPIFLAEASGKNMMIASNSWNLRFSGLSVDWSSWFGLNQLWSMMGGGHGGGHGGGGGGHGGGGGGGPTITPVPNIEGQGWRTALGCAL
jgi:hypothetical protein